MFVTLKRQRKQSDRVIRRCSVALRFGRGGIDRHIRLARGRQDRARNRLHEAREAHALLRLRIRCVTGDNCLARQKLQPGSRSSLLVAKA